MATLLPIRPAMDDSRTASTYCRTAPEPGSPLRACQNLAGDIMALAASAR